jgi:hypothetical protein
MVFRDFQKQLERLGFIRYLRGVFGDEPLIPTRTPFRLSLVKSFAFLLKLAPTPLVSL